MSIRPGITAKAAARALRRDKAFLRTTGACHQEGVVEEAEILRLARADQVRFAEALIDPLAPTDRLKRAAERHAALIQPR